ncbi:hypothetical protein Aglo01_36190 [Actinokineospora globicatena]|nr:hypothetical protein Aglo01_36190 [Actinokineospora globicatena]GLW86453.1 hypothetical protein Aglo02_40920 [Actinokineospora globicatena]
MFEELDQFRTDVTGRTGHHGERFRGMHRHRPPRQPSDRELVIATNTPRLGAANHYVRFLSWIAGWNCVERWRWVGWLAMHRGVQLGRCQPCCSVRWKVPAGRGCRVELRRALRRRWQGAHRGHQDRHRVRRGRAIGGAIGAPVGAAIGGAAGGWLGGKGGEWVTEKFEGQIEEGTSKAQDWLGDKLGFN